MFKTSTRSIRALSVLCVALLLATGCSKVITSETVLGDDDEAPARAHATKAVDLSAAVTPVEVGKTVPDFTLKDTAGKEHTLSEVLAGGQIVVLEWFNPDCPIARNYHDTGRSSYSKQTSMAATSAALAKQGVTWIAINSGAPGNQGAGLERNQQAVEEFAIAYPVLLDESGEVGRKYAAKTTPHMFVILADGTLVYDGAIDDGSTRAPGEHNLVVAAVRDVQAGKPVETAETQPFGCSVKYGK